MPITNALYNYPQPNKEKYQRSIDVDDLYLYRLSPPWARPSTLPANTWRQWVLNQPVAMVCRESLVATMLSLDWKITPRNSKYREELEPTIKYYTKLFTNGGEYGALQLDYAGLIEWIVGDLLDTPFGGAAEIGRRGNSPDGRVVWIRPLDSGTLYPTLNSDFPTVQYYMQYEAVAFPAKFIARTYMSPHSMIWREGWGMAPPEKIYFALEMLNRGDKYYSNLLLDVPTAGILDLGDMEKGSAEEWINAFKTFVTDTTQSFRIPVLYEHNNPINFLPFGKVPNDIMFDRITLKYSALVASAYGMSLSDIGLQTTSASGETLAGSIRQERRTKKTGHARVKAKIKAFFDQILPETLEFNLIDYDDELNVALGRARLATGQAFAAFRKMGLFSPQELRSQSIQDGLVSVTMPDEIPPDAKPDPILKPNAEPELIGNKKAPSAGGEGEVSKSLIDSVSFKAKSRNLQNFVDALITDFVPKLLETFSTIGEDEFDVMKSMISDAVLDEEDSLMLGNIISGILANRSLGTFQFGELEKEFETLLGDDYPSVNIKSLVYTFKGRLNKGLSDFIGRAVVVTSIHSNLNSEALMDDIRSAIFSSLPEYISAFVSTEAQVILEESKATPLPLSESIKMKSLGVRTKPMASSQLPSITINVPERNTNVDVHVPEQKSEITVNVPETVVNIDNKIPEQNSPDVYVNVPKQEAPVVNLSVPDAPAPIVNITTPDVKVSVSPTPVEITNPVTVNIPKVSKEHQTVQRDEWGNIVSTDTKISYEDDKENGV